MDTKEKLLNIIKENKKLKEALKMKEEIKDSKVAESTDPVEEKPVEELKEAVQEDEEMKEEVKEDEEMKEEVKEDEEMTEEVKEDEEMKEEVKEDEEMKEEVKEDEEMTEQEGEMSDVEKITEILMALKADIDEIKSKMTVEEVEEEQPPEPLQEKINLKTVFKEQKEKDCEFKEAISSLFKK